MDENALNEAFASVEKTAGKIHIVVANVGYLPAMEPATTQDLGEWWKGIEVNLKGPLLTFRAWMAHKSSEGTPTFIYVNAGRLFLLLYLPFCLRTNADLQFESSSRRTLRRSPRLVRVRLSEDGCEQPNHVPTD